MAKKTANGKRPAPLFETLEPRLLLSAEGLGAVVADPGLDDDLELPQGGAEIALLQPEDSEQVQIAALSETRELVFVDPRTPDYQALVDDLLSQTGADRQIDVVVLDGTRNGIEQIGDVLARYDGLDAVHLISHGGAGTVQIGHTVLGFETLLGHAKAIQAWSDALSPEADILLYGCNLAATEDGQALVDSLSRLTGADVAASDDLTGAAARGGDWVLEYTSGAVETVVAPSMDVQAGWAGVLADSGFKDPSALGDDYNQWTGGGNAYASDDARAREDVNGRQQDWYNFNFSVPTGAQIDGIEVRVEAQDSDTSGNGIDIELSWDGGATYTSTGYGTASLSPGSDSIYTYGGSADTWGRIWSNTELADANFRLRLTKTGNDGTFAEVDHIQVKISYASGALWLSTDNDLGGPGADGLPGGWSESHMLEFGGPDLTFGPATDGDFSVVMDFDPFAADATDLGALHYVGRDITVGAGANSFALNEGDLLVSFHQDETILAAYYETGLDTIVHDQDVLVFRPSAPGDYSAGTFYMLLDDVVPTDLRGISLVERPTIVGGTSLAAGTFIIAQETSPSEDIYHFVPTGVGAGAATSGSFTSLVDGSDINIDTSVVRGLELIESTTVVGGMTLPYGSILVSLRDDEPSVGNNNLPTLRQDVFLLEVTSAEPITGTTAATATMFLDGSLVNLDNTPGTENPYAIALVNAPELVVDTTSDAADGDTTSIAALLADRGADDRISLREAIMAANNTPNGTTPDAVHFEIADALVGGAHTILVGNIPDGNNGALPTITDTIIIDGTTDADFGSSPIIELDGSTTGAGINGLTITADGSTVRGLVINQFGGDGIHINAGDGNLIEGNYIGTDVSGTLDLGNAVAGVFVSNGASSNTIGGLTAAARNVISGNNDDGIKIEATAGSGNAVIGNYIGLDASGTSGLGNGGSGIDVQADGNSIGGTATEARNITSDNTFNGVVVSGSGNTVQGNYIGTDANGNAVFGNGRNGIWMNGGSNNLIGGTTAGAGNLVADNAWDGIRVSGATATGNAFLGNSIYGNTGSGIDLSGDGITANDALPGDADSGPNDLQNYPLLATALTDNATTIVISGTLNSTAGTTFRIEFFANTSGNAEGRRYLDAATVTTDGSGDASFLESVSAVVAAGEYVTATATVDLGGGNYGDTSEFSAAVLVVDSSLVSITANDATAAEAGAEAGQFTVDLGVPNSTGGAVTVSYSVAGSATGSSDYSALSGSVTVADGAQTATIDVSVLDDGLFESDETVIVTLTGTTFPGAAIDLANDTATVTISDDETRPTISIANAALVEGDAGSANLNFTVTRTGDAEADQTFNYSFADLSTEAGDFNHTAGSVVFAQGENSKTITVDVNGDTLFEGDETFTVTAVDAADAGNTASATGTITDNETRPTISIANASLVEGDAGTANLSFTVTRTGDAEADQTFNYSFADISTEAGDFSHTAGSVVFAQGENSKTITVAVNGDTLFEADETFTVTAVDAADAGNTASATGTLTDNETATANLAVTTHGNETGPVDALFTVTLDTTNDTGAAISFDLTGIGGTATEGAGNDYLLPGGAQITVAAGAASGTYSLTVNDDALLEGTETVQVQIANPSDADVTLGTATATANIADDDGATVAINDLTVNEAAGTATLTVTLTGNVPGGFTVDYASSDSSASAGSDYTATSGTLAFTGTNAETRLITVTLTDDDWVEADETLNLVLSNLSNGLVSFSDDTGVVTLTNDDNTPVVTAGQTFTVGELAGNGTSLGSVAATDADGGTTFQSWSIVSGNTGGLFDINPATGELTVLDNTTLDFETLPTSYTLGITVSDGTNTSATQSVAVNVTDVPASAPAGQVFSLSEAAANGSPAGSVAATGDTPVGFAITAGNPGTAFAIDNAGNLTVNDATQLNFEGTASYTLTLDVGDGTSTTNQSVTINLTDANDAPVLDNSPAPTLTPLTEDNLANSGNQLLSLLGAWVTDEDAAAFEGIALTGLASGNGTWQFSTDGGGSWGNAGAVADNNALLLRDTDHIRFVPDGQNADSGAITYRAWDRSSGATGTKVNASSNGGATAFSTASETAAITVTALNDAPNLAGASYSLDTGSPVGTSLGAVAGSDVDVGDTLTYSILAGNTGGAFAIDPATGQLSVADSTGLTDGAGFNLTVQVTDSGAPVLVDTAAVTIQVNTPPPPVTPPPVEPPPVIEPPPVVEPPPVIGSEPPPESGDPDDDEPEEQTRSPAGGGTAQPNTPAESSPLLGAEEPPGSPLSGVDELRYGDRDRTRPALVDRPDLYDGPPPVQLPQVVAAAEPIELPAMQQPALWGALDMMAQQMNDAEEWREQERERQVTLQATTGVAVTLSAGFVTWLLRAGTLASSLLSSMPLWRGFDPLPVVGFTAREHKRLKAAAGRLHKDEAQAHPDVERLFDRASESDGKPRKKAGRKARLKGGRRAAPVPSR